MTSLINHGRWLWKEMRKERHREGQGRVQTHSQQGLTTDWVSEPQSWTLSLTPSASSKHGLGWPWDKAEPETAHLVGHMLGPLSSGSPRLCVPQLAFELGKQGCVLPQGRASSQASWPLHGPLGQGTLAGHTHGFHLRGEDMTLCNTHQTQDFMSGLRAVERQMCMWGAWGKGARNWEAQRKGR